MVLDVVKGTVERAIVYRAGIVSRCHALLREASLFPSHYTTHMLSSHIHTHTQLIQPHTHLDLLAPMPGLEVDKPRVLMLEGNLKFRDPSTAKVV